MRRNATLKRLLQIVSLALSGLVLGAIAGAAIGIACGLAFTGIFPTQSSASYSGLLIFLTFMPIGIVSGAISGAIGFGTLALHSRGMPMRIAPRENIS